MHPRLWLGGVAEQGVRCGSAPAQGCCGPGAVRPQRSSGVGPLGRRDGDRGRRGPPRGQGGAPVLDGRVDGTERLAGIRQNGGVAVAWPRAGDQAVGLKPEETLPGEGDVQADAFGDVDEPHRAARVEDLDHGGGVPQPQTLYGVLDAFGFGHPVGRQVGAGPVSQGAVHGRQGLAEHAESVRSPIALVGSDDQPVRVHGGQPLADELLADEGEPGGDISYTHGTALLGQGHRRPGGPLRPHQGERVLDALGIERTDGKGGGPLGRIARVHSTASIRASSERTRVGSPPGSPPVQMWSAASSTTYAASSSRPLEISMQASVIREAASSDWESTST